jgi:membrane protease YdiL (CAAX protease family)
LHILPGIFILVLFVIVAPLATRAGLPPLVSVLGSAALGLSFQVWHLLHEGKKRNGKWSLKGVIQYNEPIPFKSYLWIVPLFLVPTFILGILTDPIGKALLNLMPWLPAWFEVRDAAQLMQYPRWIRVFTYLVLVFPINGIAAPIIEELYFRGYLMPRLSRFGIWTPLLAAALFTLYHFWQPYYWITQFLSILPLVYVVWWKRNVRLGIIIHASLNILGGLLNLMLILGK